MGSVTFTLMIITIISKITGAVREIIFSSLFGTGEIKDIYVISQSVAALSFSFLFMSIQSTFIPMYENVRRKNGRRDADLFTSNLTNTFVLLCTIVVAICFVFMPQILGIVADGFSPATMEKAILFTRIVIFQIYFSAMNGSMISYLNVYNNFVTPATTGIIQNLVLFFFSWLTVRTGNMYVLAIGSVCSMGLQYIFFPFALRKTGYRHKLFLQPKHPHILESMEIAIPAMFSILVNDISIIVDKSIATSVLPSGGPSALDYANKLFMLVQGIVIVSIVTAAYPRMTRLAGLKNKDPFKRSITNALVTGLLIVIPSTVGMMIFATPITRLFFERGQFTAESTALTAGALFWYAPGLIALMCNQIFVRAFYSLQDTKTPLIVSTAQVAVDITLNFILSHFFGLNGLAASTMIGNTVGAVALGILLVRKAGHFRFRQMSISLGKASIATAIMAFLAKRFFEMLRPTPEGIRFLMMLVLAMVVYGTLILFARIPEVRKLINKLYHKFAGRRR